MSIFILHIHMAVYSKKRYNFFFEPGKREMLNKTKFTHTHTHTHIYIYIYIYNCLVYDIGSIV
jgi:hypothetical protein